MTEIKALTMKEICSKEHLKKFKTEELQSVIDILNANWFATPVSSKAKESMAKAIAELALGDLEFRNNYFEENPEATITMMFDEIVKNTDSNNSLPEDLTDEEYEEQELPAPMITPDEVDNEKNGLTDDILIIIQDLTEVDYLSLYGFEVEKEEIEEKEEQEVEIKEPTEEIKEVVIEQKKEKKPEPEKQKTNSGEMGVSTIDFNEALKIVSSGLGREENESLIRFEKTNIRTYSSMISVLHPFVTGITGSVEGKDLVGIIKQLPQQDVNLSQTDEKLVIKGNQANIQFNFNTLMMPCVSIPGNDSVWIPLPKDFSEMIAIASLSCSPKGRNPYNCVIVEKDSIVACKNGHRGLEVVMAGDFHGKMNIPGKMAKIVSTYHPYEVCIDSSFFHFRNAHGTIISLRQYATGQFSQAFYDNLNLKGVEVMIPAGTKQLIERSSVLAGREFTDYVSIKVHKGSMVISARSEKGCSTETIALKNNEVEVEFAIHPILFKEIIGIVSSMEVCENYVLFKGENVTCWISKTIPAVQN